MKNSRMVGKTGWFVRFAQWVSRITGSPIAFMTAVGAIVIWAVLGPVFKYSDTWQLVINTGTTIITFLMVFVIQNTQNRDTAAMHIKIDELIRVSGKARNILLNLEELDDKELESIRGEYECLADEDQERMREQQQEKQAEEASKRAQRRAPPTRGGDPDDNARKRKSAPRKSTRAKA